MTKAVLIVMTPAQTAAAAASQLSQTVPSVEVRLVAACGGATPMRVKGTTQTVCLDQSVWANQNDVESARVEKDLKGKPMIILTLETRAAARVRDLAVKNIGNSVGIVLNGEVVVAPRIVGRFSEIAIRADFSAPEAEAIVAAFNRRDGKR